MNALWKQVFNFEMTPIMATSVFFAIFAVVAFACAIARKLFLERQNKIASEKTVAALKPITADENLGDGI